MISIITSLYKSEKYIHRYIKHVSKVSNSLSKNNIEHEFIMIFNSPSDTEKNIIEKIKLNNNIKSKIIICPRETLYATWNRGIKEAKYDKITFWNVDDIRFDKAIIDGIDKINNGIELVYFPFIYKRYIWIFDFKILVKYKIIKTIDYDKTLFTTGMYIGPFFMIKKEVFEKIGLFDESYKIAGDFEFAVRASKHNILFDKSDVLAGVFTNDGRTLSGKKDKLQQEENKRIAGIM